MTCVIVEDEELLARSLEKMVKEEKIDVLACVHNVKEAISIIENQKPDFLLLDINLGNLTGFDVLKELNYKPYVIFTTAYSEYAVKAFEVNAVDYVLKPVKKERLRQAIDKIRFIKERGEAYLSGIEQIENLLKLIRSVGEFKELQNDRLPIETANEIIFVKFEDILYIESEGKNTLIALKKERKVTKQPLKDIETKLPKSEFVRVYKSFLISKRYIKKIIKNYFGRLAIEMENGEIIPVSRHYKENLMKLLEIEEN